MTEKYFDVLATMKKAGIAVAIILIILGLCMFIDPIASGAFFMWCIVIGVFVHGVHKLVEFFRMPKGSRDGFLLASGILMVLVCVIMVADQFSTQLIVIANMEVCIAIMLGFICIFSGVGKICISRDIKAVYGTGATAVLCGVIEIICGAVVLGAPLMGFLSLTVVFGCYLLIMGITLLIKSISIKSKDI